MKAINIQPIVSIVVSVFNMQREAKRTLLSLTSKYQEGVSEQDYEVIVVDDGSSAPLSADYVAGLRPNFKYYYFENTSLSPAPAINFGVRQSIGRAVGIMVDGARILSPGIIKYALRAFKIFQNPVVSTLGWHLGPDVQMRSILNGYNQKVEDQLLESVDWPKDGYRLFGISSFAGSSSNGWFMPIAESNCLFMYRETFDELGGLDERFELPAGGIVNHDTYIRACELPDSELVVLLGEGNFHQVHGGTTTNISEQENHIHWKKCEEEYINIRAKKFVFPRKCPEYIGHVPPQALKWILYSAETAIKEPNKVQS